MIRLMRGPGLVVLAGLVFVLLAWALPGCGGQGAKDNNQPIAKDSGTKAKDPVLTEKEKEIQEALADLSPEDRKLAESQKYCVVQTESRLGSMGTPDKLTIKGETVFTCCKGCNKKAQANPEKTLKTLENLKAKAKAEEPSSQIHPEKNRREASWAWRLASKFHRLQEGQT